MGYPELVTKNSRTNNNVVYKFTTYKPISNTVSKSLLSNNNILISLNDVCPLVEVTPSNDVIIKCNTKDAQNRKILERLLNKEKLTTPAGVRFLKGGLTTFSWREKFIYECIEGTVIPGGQFKQLPCRPTELRSKYDEKTTSTLIGDKFYLVKSIPNNPHPISSYASREYKDGYMILHSCNRHRWLVDTNTSRCTKCRKQFGAYDYLDTLIALNGEEL